MNRREMAVILQYAKEVWPNMEQGDNALEIWFAVCETVDGEVGMTAIKSLAGKIEWPPKPARFREECSLVAKSMPSPARALSTGECNRCDDGWIWRENNTVAACSCSELRREQIRNYDRHLANQTRRIRGPEYTDYKTAPKPPDTDTWLDRNSVPTYDPTDF